MGAPINRPQSTIVTVGGITSITSRTAPNLRTIIPTQKSVQDPLALSRMIEETQQAASDATAAARSRHDAGGVLFLDLAFAAGETKVLQHRMEKPVKGWRPERWRNLAGLPLILDEIANSNPKQEDAAQIKIRSTNACLVNIAMWGG